MSDIENILYTYLTSLVDRFSFPDPFFHHTLGMTQRNLSITSYIPILIACLYQIYMSRKQIIFYIVQFPITEPVNDVALNSLYKSVRPWKERNIIYLLLFFLFFFPFAFFFLYALPCKSLRRRCTIKPRRFFSCSCVLMVRIQGQLSNNMGACVCLCVVDATSCSSERFFGCRLGRKEIEKKDERERMGRRKRKYFCDWLSVGIRFSSAFG